MTGLRRLTGMGDVFRGAGGGGEPTRGALYVDDDGIVRWLAHPDAAATEDLTAWESRPTPHDDLTRPARPARGEPR